MRTDPQVYLMVLFQIKFIHKEHFKLKLHQKHLQQQSVRLAAPRQAGGGLIAPLEAHVLFS